MLSSRPPQHTFNPRSSWIKTVRFNANLGEAYITTKFNETYVVEGLSSDELRAFRYAESFGKWFNQHIRNRKNVVKVKLFEATSIAK